MTINIQKKYTQYIIVRGDVPLPEGFMANQIGHAVAACPLSKTAWLENNREASPGILEKINVSSTDTFKRNMDNFTAWSSSIFYKTIVRAKGPDELLEISSVLAEKGIGYVLIKESGSVRIDKVAEIIKLKRILRCTSQRGIHIFPHIRLKPAMLKMEPYTLKEQMNDLLSRYSVLCQFRKMTFPLSSGSCRYIDLNLYCNNILTMKI
jgi:peptidyl-tRNA hydrolase